MSIPSIISELVEKFELHKDSYTSGTYNEAQLRIEFIDPFFEALGWDINNRQGYAENYKEVIHEDAIKVGGVTKAPDYCFRIGGVRKFFLEAKKPSVDIKEAIHPAYQLRRYAWSAKLPLSILTDFEEFAIYDCRIKPSPTDKSSQARTLYLQYSDYINKWDDITNIFSKDAILKGSFDKYVESKKGKKGTAEVDDAFLKEIESWRDILARNIAIRNPQLSQRELNFAIQQSIDRIIFLRICEDRGIENYGRLQALLNGTQIYNRLTELFRMADERYNSGLFYFRKESGRFGSPDELTLNLTIDDNTLKEIIKNLYYPDSPYEFSVLPAYILGYVYEQFLGKVIRLTAGHRAVVEEKPEVRKAGGVYYTPTYIVDYIVKNTVGKLVENKSPNEVEKLRILDPACGSGSFLLGAYQYLLDWHQDWYTKNNPEKWLKGRNPRLVERRKGDFRLTTPERKRILLNNIYGVDIDPQAVEVTKLSLLLKVLEGETEETIVNQLKLFHERALPDLANNIKCGNSLIGPDFYENQQMDMFNEEERYRINAFDWNTEFPDIMHTGGFDAVIGNPPYIRVDSLPEIEKKYYILKYSSPEGKYDLYYLFIEKSLQLLAKNRFFGMIIPNRFCSSDSGKKLRDIIINYSKEVLINSVSMLNVFGKAKNYPVILIINKLNIKNKCFLNFILSKDKTDLNKEIPVILSLEKNNIEKIPEKIFPVNVTQREINLYLSLSAKNLKLKDYLKISEGFRISTSSENNVGDEHIIKQYQFSRYSIINPGTYINYEDRRKIISDSSERYINSIKEKIIIAEDALKIEATIDLSKSLCQGGVYFATLKQMNEQNIKLFFLLGVLNSALMSFIYKSLFGGMHMGGGYLRFRTKFLEQLPIPDIDFRNAKEKEMHDKILKKVELMLDLNKKIASSKTEHDKTYINRQIEATDRQIDRLVYELYGLTKEEISIIEETFK